MPKNKSELAETSESKKDGPDITLEEKQAIMALARLSLRWPKSLYVSSENGKTVIKKTSSKIGEIDIPHE